MDALSLNLIMILGGILFGIIVVGGFFLRIMASSPGYFGRAHYPGYVYGNGYSDSGWLWTLVFVVGFFMYVSFQQKEIKPSESEVPENKELEQESPVDGPQPEYNTAKEYEKRIIYTASLAETRPVKPDRQDEERPIPKGNWYIQLNSYREKSNATEFLTQAKADLNQSLRIYFDETSGLHKVVAGPFAEEAEARGVQKQKIPKGFVIELKSVKSNNTP